MTMRLRKRQSLIGRMLLACGMPAGVVICLAWACAVVAQEPRDCRLPLTLTARPGISGAVDDHRRTADLLTADADLPSSRRGSTPSSPSRCDPGIWDIPGDWRGDGIHLAPLQLDGLYNSAYPSGVASGQLWPGRGWSTLISGGVRARFGPLSAAVEPAFAYIANEPFPFIQHDIDRPEFSYPWQEGIDWPLRPGRDSYWSLSPGQSYVRVDYPTVAFGISTENLWWGPAVRNGLMLANEAPGFPHAFLSSGSGWTTPVGRISGEMIWGILGSSPGFAPDSGDNRRLLAGLTLSWQPVGVAGLTLGAARIHHQQFDEGSFPAGSLVPFLEESIGDVSSADADRLLGLFARYAVASTGFEVYGEYGWQSARDDTAADTRAARGYTVGFQQVIDGGSLWYRVRGELTNLNAVRFTGDDTPSWYTHARIAQGYTHRGQLLGARIGPGSDSQYLGADVFTARGKHGVFVERVRYDEVAHYRWIAPVTLHRGHDVELTAGTEHVLWFGSVGLRAGVSVSSRRNRHFRFCNPLVDEPLFCQSRPFRDLNWQVPLGVVWRPQ